MDNFLYKTIGYKTDFLLYYSAIKIQKTYKNYRDYQIKKRIDILKNNIPEKKNNRKDEDDDKDELKYWNQMRNLIKYESKNYICL